MSVGKKVRTAIPVTLWLLALAGAAHAAEVYQGSDVSYSSDANRRMVVCDNEADGRGVHADYRTFLGQDWRVDDLDGFAGHCWESPQRAGGIARHRTVEEINNWPDAKSAWSYH